MTLEEEIKAIQDEMDKTQKNKATEHHLGRLKAKMARLKDELIKRAISSKGGAEGYSVKKSGDATVTLVGLPSVGKSTLINKLTDANSEVGAYEFTTLDVIPGIMEYRQAKIQVLDLPGLVRGASAGRGRGREVISVIRSCDLILMIVDAFNYKQLKVLEDELYDAGIRINQHPPDVTITKLVKGGVTVTSTIELSLDHETIKTILGEYKMHNALVNVREDITADQLIDVVRGNRVYIPAIIIVNKIDLVDGGLIKKFPADAIKISADMELNLDVLRDEIYDSLGFINVYLKPQGEQADMEEPLIMREGCTVGDVCDRLHKDFRRKFRYARVWGDSAKHAGQRIGLDHLLLDGDVLTIIIQK
jgi:small GTP-binding protein